MLSVAFLYSYKVKEICCLISFYFNLILRWLNQEKGNQFYKKGRTCGESLAARHDIDVREEWGFQV